MRRFSSAGGHVSCRFGAKQCGFRSLMLEPLFRAVFLAGENVRLGAANRCGIANGCFATAGRF